jgi:hypothetical protein
MLYESGIVYRSYRMVSYGSTILDERRVLGVWYSVAVQ